MTDPSKSPRDLALAAAAAVLSLGLMALPFGGLVKALALMPLVLFLPGYALTAACFPGRRLAPSERLLYSFALSVGAASLGGLAWQLAFDLDRFAWASLLCAITLAGCLVALRRRTDGPRASDWLGQLPRPGPLTAIAALVAIAIAVTAVAVATDGLEEQRAEAHFSALWAVPSRTDGERVEVGVWNHQGAPHQYRLEVLGDGERIWRWRGRLGAQKNRETTLGPALIPPGARLVIELYRDGVLYRRTELQTGAEA